MEKLIECIIDLFYSLEDFCVELIKSEKVRMFCAFSYYFLFIIFGLIDLPSKLELIVYIYLAALTELWILYQIYAFFEFIFYENQEGICTLVLDEFKKITKEILMFIPISIIFCLIISAFIVGTPANQAAIEEEFDQSIIINSLFIIIIGPIIEETLCRLLPYKFIKKAPVYIIVSAFVFAGLHVVEDPNPFIYIWAYVPDALYYGYRYYKTQDILVTISLHSFHNLVSVLIMILQLKTFN